jgi:hypothetical protein
MEEIRLTEERFFRVLYDMSGSSGLGIFTFGIFIELTDLLSRLDIPGTNNFPRFNLPDSLAFGAE